MVKKSGALQVLDDELKSTIRKMKKLQKAIASDAQPVSMHEIDQLTALGGRYGELVSEMQALVEKARGTNTA